MWYKFIWIENLHCNCRFVKACVSIFVFLRFFFNLRFLKQKVRAWLIRSRICFNELSQALEISWQVFNTNKIIPNAILQSSTYYEIFIIDVRIKENMKFWQSLWRYIENCMLLQSFRNFYSNEAHCVVNPNHAICIALSYYFWIFTSKYKKAENATLHFTYLALLVSVYI